MKPEEIEDGKTYMVRRDHQGEEPARVLEVYEIHRVAIPGTRSKADPQGRRVPHQTRVRVQFLDDPFDGFQTVKTGAVLYELPEADDQVQIDGLVERLGAAFPTSKTGVRYTPVGPRFVVEMDQETATELARFVGLTADSLAALVEQFEAQTSFD